MTTPVKAKSEIPGTASSVKKAPKSTGKQKPPIDLSYQTDVKYTDAKALLQTLITKQQHLFLHSSDKEETVNTTAATTPDSCGKIEIDGTAGSDGGDASITKNGDGDIAMDVDVVSATTTSDGAVVTCESDLSSHADTSALVSEWEAQVQAKTITPATTSMSDVTATKLIAHLVQGSSGNLREVAASVGKVLFSGDQGKF
jgi:hypothetical protein